MLKKVFLISGSDDSIMERTPSMIFTDAEFNSSTLQGLSKLRKNRQFCDVILQVCAIISLLFITRLLFHVGVFLALTAC
jgi:hypothetical protein